MEFSFRSSLIAVTVVAGASFLIGFTLAPQHQNKENPSGSGAEGAGDCSAIVARYDQLREQYVALQENVAPTTSPTISPTSEPICTVGTPSAVPSPQSASPTLEDSAVADSNEINRVNSSAVELESREIPTELDKVTALSTEQLLTNTKKLNDDSASAGSGGKRRNFLNRIVLQDPHRTIDMMREADEKERWLKSLYGVFRGGVTYLKKKRESGYIRLEIRNPESPPWQWAIKVDLHESKGNADRRTGGLELLRVLEPNGKAFFLRSSENSYMQFYFVPSEDVLIGNLYMRLAAKGESGEYQRVGTFTLRRSQD